MKSIIWDDQDSPHVTGDASDWHVHPCADGCGAFYVCGQRDGCDRDWTCPRCEADRVDHYWNLEYERIQAHKETR